MTNIAAVALISVNTLVLALLAAFGVLVSLPAYGGEASLRTICTLLVVGIPHVALLVGVRRAASPPWTGVALAVNCIWALVLVVAGAVAATGLAGLTGILLVVVPDFVVICINAVALARKLRGRWLTSRSSGAPAASADL